LYADASKVKKSNIIAYDTYIIPYADDILLVAKSVTAMQRMLWLCGYTIFDHVSTLFHYQLRLIVKIT